MFLKKGFTLSEVLVALGVVGVIAAITIPAIQRIMPDKDKGIVLKAYNTLNSINNDIFSNPGLYMFGDNCNRYILQCTDKPVDGSDDQASGMDKYPRLFVRNLELANSVTFNAGNGNFRTSDGVDWTIEAHKDPRNRPTGYVITIDVHNPNRTACTYNSSSCPNPGRFSFAVDVYGTIRPWDALSEAYINNPNDLSDRYGDLRAASRSTTEFNVSALAPEE